MALFYLTEQRRVVIIARVILCKDCGEKMADQFPRIRKVVFPVAGMGTRFLPATKANPKEMLPIVDKPLIQYAVEEAIEAGCDEIIFVTGRSKRSIEDHFGKIFCPQA